MSAVATGRHVHVHGGTLAGIAAALRLARAGHRVTLDPAGPLGGPVDDLEPVLALPAAWRDLMKKSGGHLVTALNAHHLELVPAPPATHRWSDGTEVTLPDDRAGQTAALRAVFGEAAAQRWTTLLDQVDDVWQALRLTCVERPWPSGGPSLEQAKALMRGRTLGQLADQLDDPRLAALLLSHGRRAGASDPRQAPAWLATRATVQRTFGRWQLVGADTSTDPTAHAMDALVTVLTDRLAERGVELEAGGAGADARIDAVAPAPTRPPLGAWARFTDSVRRTVGHQPGPVTSVRPPHISHDVHADLDVEPGSIRETVFHTEGGVVVGWQRATPAGVLVTSHDHTRPGDPDPAFGWDLSHWDHWAARPPIEPAHPAGPWRASSASHAGNEPWAQVLSAALATYQVHERLTGADIRPTNKATTTHRPRGTFAPG
ncbi:hypothetical protein ACQB6R_05190 [Propionibacteriaceae bacterium G1746]|uniref:hypothetical protein n=1 Tax=Aestuariimicrobium sp. G57 TaxID=3418485 RepID=UPI003C174E93